MTYTENLWLFTLLLTGIIVVPGMDMLFVLANALTGGRRAGLAATFGMMAGGACHTLLGTVAVAALSTLIPTLSPVMLVLGAGYMIWIGMSLARSSITVDHVEGEARRATIKIFAQGLLTCLLNPKAWTFILAVYPPFMKPVYGPFWSQALVMGALTMAIQLIVYGGLALAAARGREALVSNPGLTIAIGRAAGWLLVAVAAYMLVRSWQGW
ncbi:LysE family translocator [Rhizobium wuzhouense]|uniref:LysE family translocator n=1 Tax=Rhizobium wuzhouense TaxID=1986026 RepID=A0ABX5NV29_9HYPH|nr:LysE family translocator [Rhizobium wuzhouense]PYB77025.1 LysE family translocator [Rhizobium wuzhouense]